MLIRNDGVIGEYVIECWVRSGEFSTTGVTFVVGNEGTVDKLIQWVPLNIIPHNRITRLLS